MVLCCNSGWRRKSLAATRLRTPLVQNDNQGIVGEEFRFAGADVREGDVHPADVEFVKLPFIAYIYYGGVGLLAKGFQVGERDVSVGVFGHTSLQQPTTGTCSHTLAFGNVKYIHLTNLRLGAPAAGKCALLTGLDKTNGNGP